MPLVHIDFHLFFSFFYSRRHHQHRLDILETTRNHSMDYFLTNSTATTDEIRLVCWLISINAFFFTVVIEKRISDGFVDRRKSTYLSFLLTEIKSLARNVNPHKLPMRVAVVVVGEAFLVRDQHLSPSRDHQRWTIASHFCSTCHSDAPLIASFTFIDIFTVDIGDRCKRERER